MPGRHVEESIGRRGLRATSGGHTEESVGQRGQQATLPIINYGRRPTPDGMSLQPTSSSCWSPPWPPSPQSTGAPSLRAATSAPCSQPIYCEWMGLSGHGGICCFLFFGREFSWWKVTFFLSSFLLVLLVDCYVVHCPSFASFA
jgi:hypothetical protein